MLRITLFEIVAFLLPFLIFLVWRWQVKSGVRLESTLALRLAGVGVGLAVIMLIALVALDARESGQPGDIYIPSRIVDGRVVPAHFESAGPVEPADSDAASDDTPDEEPQ